MLSGTNNMNIPQNIPIYRLGVGIFKNILQYIVNPNEHC